MAAIDKLYLTDYVDYVDLVKWATVYKPTLLFNITTDISESEWNKWKQSIVDARINAIINIKERIGVSVNENFDESTFITKYVKFYKSFYKDNIYDIDDTIIQSFIDDAQYYIDSEKELLSKDKYDLYSEVSIQVAKFTYKQDKYLKWFCPIYGVREYLHKQCGVKKKYEWFYKLFFKGKKYI